MTGLTAFVLDLVPETLRDPRRAARRLLDLGLPMEARWLGLLLVVVLAVFETALANALLPETGEPPFMVILSNPWFGLPAQALAMVVVAAVTHRVGRVFGGRGDFADTLLIVTWVEFVMTVMQFALLLILLALPPFGVLLAFGVVIGFVWVMAQFIAELHGFRNIFLVLLGMVAGFAIVVTILATVFSLFGLVPRL